MFAAFFQVVGSLKLAEVNVPVAMLIWLMIVPMLLKMDFGAVREVKRHSRGIGVTLFINWAVKLFSIALPGWLLRLLAQPAAWRLAPRGVPVRVDRDEQFIRVGRGDRDQLVRLRIGRRARDRRGRAD
jgi:hypothetical protein